MDLLRSAVDQSRLAINDIISAVLPSKRSQGGGEEPFKPKHEPTQRRDSREKQQQKEGGFSVKKSEIMQEPKASVTGNTHHVRKQEQPGPSSSQQSQRSPLTLPVLPPLPVVGAAGGGGGGGGDRQAAAGAPEGTQAAKTQQEKGFLTPAAAFTGKEDVGMVTEEEEKKTKARPLPLGPEKEAPPEARRPSSRPEQPVSPAVGCHIIDHR